jgi:hypothetical protein
MTGTGPFPIDIAGGVALKPEKGQEAPLYQLFLNAVQRAAGVALEEAEDS